MRQFSLLENILCGIDNALRTVCVPTRRSSLRDTPAHALSDVMMSQEDRRQTASLMRVNHSGEVCAQALYQGQALTAQLTTVKQQMLAAADDEIDHLAWCEQRLRELDSQPSVLNVFWYVGSFTMGAVAGLVGDRWSLGFVAETERQVAAHLQKHLEKIAITDVKTRTILAVMQEDEAHHADVATAAGAATLPFVIKKLMHAVSFVMTSSSYYI